MTGTDLHVLAICTLLGAVAGAGMMWLYTDVIRTQTVFRRRDEP